MSEISKRRRCACALCAVRTGYDGRSGRGGYVACASFSDPGCHGFGKIAAGYRIGAPFRRGDRLGRQYAGEQPRFAAAHVDHRAPRCGEKVMCRGTTFKLNLFTVCGRGARWERSEKRRSPTSRASPLTVDMARCAFGHSTLFSSRPIRFSRDDTYHVALDVTLRGRVSVETRDARGNFVEKTKKM